MCFSVCVSNDGLYLASAPQTRPLVALVDAPSLHSLRCAHHLRHIDSEVAREPSIEGCEALLPPDADGRLRQATIHCAEEALEAQSGRGGT